MPTCSTRFAARSRICRFVAKRSALVGHSGLDLSEPVQRHQLTGDFTVNSCTKFYNCYCQYCMAGRQGLSTEKHRLSLFPGQMLLAMASPTTVHVAYPTISCMGR